jgi:signal transduction histidine kinase
VGVPDVVGGLLPLVEHAARRRDVRLSATVAADLPLILADPDQLKQVLLNLFVNALEATPAKGSVELAAEPASHDGRAGVRISVSDTGPGIPAELVGKVFNAFFTTKPRGQGTGLGLAISRDIVKEHGGELQVTGAAGEGATFTIWLPQAPGVAA